MPLSLPIKRRLSIYTTINVMPSIKTFRLEGIGIKLIVERNKVSVLY